MFLLSKLFAAIALSPLLFIVLGLLGFAVYKRPRLAIFFFISTLCLIYILSISPTNYFLLRPLENKYVLNKQALERGDVYIVLGGGIIERQHTYTPFEKLSSTSLKRCLDAAYWYKRYPHPLIVCGGTPLRTGESEASCMAQALRTLGIPVKHIYKEALSRNTYENILNAKTIMRAQGWHKPLLVTSAFHLPRSMHEAHQAGLAVTPVACDFHLQSPQQNTWLGFFPEVQRLADSFIALKEYIGIVYYRLRY